MMRRELFLSIVLCVVCLLPVKAQSNVILNEAETKVVLQNNSADFSFMLENSGKAFNDKIEIELLDTEDKELVHTSQDLQIKNGKASYGLTVPLGDLMKETIDEIFWYRVRYRIGGAEGIISLSEIVDNNFELRAAAGEYVFSGVVYRVRVHAFEPYNNRPSQNVSIEGHVKLNLETTGKNEELTLDANAETDSEGFAVLDFKVPENVKFDDGDLKITGRKNGVVREISEDLDSDENRGMVILSTDKPIYQPAQTFSVRGLYLDSNRTAVSNSDLNFKIKDEEDTLLYSETVKTSEFGIAAISWKIPDNARLGEYSVEIETDESLRTNRIHFKISRYDLPNFTVAAKSNKPFYLPGENQAEIIVNADYLFGKPVTNGKVRIVQESERRWNYREQKYNTVEEQSFEGAADAEGKFVAKVDLSKAFKELLENDWRRFQDVRFAAYFTDLTTNKTEQKRFDVRLSKDPIHLYLIGRTVNQNPKLPITAYISAFYADGTPAVCNIEIKGKLESESNYETLAQVKTNRFGAGKFKLTIPPTEDSSDDLELKVNAGDSKGQEGHFDEKIDLGNDDSIKIEIGKTIFKSGESVKVNLVSTKKDAPVYVDVSQDGRVLDSYFVKLKNGKGALKIPYNSKFKGDLTIAAYTDENPGYYNDSMHSSRGIIFPTQQNLKLDANFSDAVYKPNEEAKVNFSVSDGAGRKTESALGVVVFDKAIEERARTDAEFGSYFSQFNWLLGYDESFGGITLKDLNELNLAKSIPADLQLAAEIMLADNFYYPQIYHTNKNLKEAKFVYSEFFKRQFKPVEIALKNQYAKNYDHPTNEISLRKLLRENGIDFDNLRDPWGQNYYAVFSIDKDQNFITFKTMSADKQRDGDDFSVSVLSFNYFLPIGKKIDEAVKNFYTRTGQYIRDESALRDELAKENFDLPGLKDRWNHDYRITFEILGRNYLIRFRSAGADGVYQPANRSTDDFDIWVSSIDYFAETEVKINKILNQRINLNKESFPTNENDFRKLLKDGGVDISQIRDGYGNPVYLTFAKKIRYADKIVIENGKQIITPVTQEIYAFIIRGPGKDLSGFYDDTELAEFSSVITEQSKDTLFSKADVRNIAISDAKGAIRGVVSDQMGAVIPVAQITAIDEDDETKIFTATSNDNGEFLLSNLPSGKYKIKFEASNFQQTIYTDIQIRSQNLVEISVMLQAGGVMETVNVSAGESATVNTTSASIGRTINSYKLANLSKVGKNSITQIEENSTPRLREYFPETLVWNPELLTDKNGKAELKFKLADNLTTWKLYTIASTKNGKIGVAEKEIKTFQPFFADLDPPKILTVGDEIHLPVQIRNYTESRQNVAVTMAEGNWFSFLNSANQSIEVAPNNSQNAIFGFRTVLPIKNGKQRVTAIAGKDSDAIEKPVTVHPNGQEITRTDSEIFRDSAAFNINFPAESLPATGRAELKIYPNLLSHVAESVSGLLERPYGCGEQTISSTYPNLMILKFGKTATVNEKLKAQAQNFLQKGYERLLGYQQADGGFSVWTKDNPDVALTAYAIRFLIDAKEFIAVDDDVISKARQWLLKEQRADGSWTRKYDWEKTEDANRTKIITTYVARILAMTEAGKEKKSPEATKSLQRAFDYLKIRNGEIDEPFALASFALALLDAGDSQTAQPIIEKLQTMAIAEGGASYWNLETNTPFYGWGTAGRIETTALVVQALTKYEGRVSKDEGGGMKDEVNPKSKIQNPKSADLISRGTLFLLKNKDRYGVWYSTQATVNVLDALISQLANSDRQAAEQMMEIFSNGQKIQEIKLPPPNVLANPLTVDLSKNLAPATNKIEVKIIGSNTATMAQIVSDYYVSWNSAKADGIDTNRSRQLRLDYKCDKQSAAVMQEINCTVEAERIAFRGYGMLLAEIGLPPGADVDRASLEKARNENWSFSQYDILPDRIIVYLWAGAGGAHFNFKFKPRYAINAQTAPSVVYDYYNPEAQATVAPLKFSVK